MPTSDASGPDEATLDQRALERLDIAAGRLVTLSPNDIARIGMRQIKRELIITLGVQIWVEPVVDVRRGVDDFRIKMRGYNVDLFRIADAEQGDARYAYWVAKLSSQDWAPLKRGIRFFVTRSEDRRDAEIILDSPAFPATVSDRGRTIFTIGPTDLPAIYRLTPALYPDVFRATAIEGMLVRPDGAGGYESAR